LINVAGGTFQIADGYNGSNDFSNNYSSLNIAAGALFEAMQSNVQVDALTGAGTYQAGWYGPRTLTIGISNGSGTFSGTIQGNGLNGYSQPTLNKVGTGTEVLNGTLNFHGGYGAATIVVSGGSAGSPSTLVISPTGASMIGTTDPGNSFGDGGISIGTNGGDNALLIQTAGTIGAQSAWIGTFGSGTLSIAGGTFLVGAGNLNAAMNNGGSALINVSGGKLGFLNNSAANLGAFYGEPVTVNQTGGLVAFYSDSGGLTLGGSGGVVINGGGTYTYNLAGGTLAAPGVLWTSPAGGAGGGSYVFNFNGGVLQTTASTSSYFAVPASPATATLNVASGGAIIDTLGNSVTIQEDLLHSGSTATDGGLTLLGGELILSGSNNYNGGTLVDSGTLILASPNALLDGTSLTVGNASELGGLSLGPAVAVVPEPGTLALLMAGLVIGLGAWQRRRRA
jgi:autotransporter-associated beta strand protein